MGQSMGQHTTLLSCCSVAIHTQHILTAEALPTVRTACRAGTQAQTVLLAFNSSSTNRNRTSAAGEQMQVTHTHSKHLPTRHSFAAQAQHNTLMVSEVHQALKLCAAFISLALLPAHCTDRQTDSIGHKSGHRPGCQNSRKLLRCDHGTESHRPTAKRVASHTTQEWQQQQQRPDLLYPACLYTAHVTRSGRHSVLKRPPTCLSVAAAMNTSARSPFVVAADTE